MMKRFHIFVAGKVQGVFYRDFCRKCAMLLNIKGWVRNLRDGRVELLIEGSDHDLREMISKLHVGTDAASVISLIKEEEPPTGEFKQFNVLQ